MNFPRIFAFGLCLAALCWGLGCNSREDIVQYRVPKKKPRMDRMLGAIISQTSDSWWFFKTSGDKIDVDQRADEFKKLIRSVRFVGDKPEWSLPEGWTKKPGQGMRFATLECETSGGKLELSVTRLGNNLPPEKYLLMNVNRWRRELQLPPIKNDALEKETEQLDSVGGGVAGWIVDWEGQLKNTGMQRPPMAGPFAGGGAPRPPSLTPDEYLQ